MQLKFRMVALTAAIAAGMLGTTAAQAEDTINIAVLTTMSGPAVVNVQPSVNTIKMVVDEINKTGFKVGDKTYTFNLSWFDTECKPKSAINATRAAIATVKSLNMIWANMCSSGAIASRPLLIDSGLVVLNSTSATSKFSGPKGNPFLFSLKEDFLARDRTLAKYIASQNLKTGVIVAADSNWGNEAQSSFLKAAEENGLKILDTLNYDEGTEEFSALLSQVKRAKPDFVFQISQMLNEQVAFIRTYRQLGIKSQLVGEATWTEDVPAKVGWKALDGMWTASPWVVSNPRPAVAAYVKDYEDTFKSGAPGFNGPAAYDEVQIAMQAFQQAGSLDTAKVQEVLKTHQFKDLIYGTGTTRLDDNGQTQLDSYVTRFNAAKKVREIISGQ